MPGLLDGGRMTTHDLTLIGKMLGHKSTATTARYTHLTDATVRDAIDRTGDRIEQPIRNGAGVIDLEARRAGAKPAG